MDDGVANGEAAKAYIAAMEGHKAQGDGCTCEACTLVREILKEKEYLNKSPCGSSAATAWAYDIGYGGLDPRQ